MARKNGMRIVVVGVFVAVVVVWNGIEVAHEHSKQKP
jgi:hypothetical protein